MGAYIRSVGAHESFEGALGRSGDNHRRSVVYSTHSKAPTKHPAAPSNHPGVPTDALDAHQDCGSASGVAGQSPTCPSCASGGCSPLAPTGFGRTLSQDAGKAARGISGERQRMKAQVLGLRVAGTIFSLVGLAHLLRWFTGTSVLIGGWTLPLITSLSGAVITGALGLWLRKLSLRSHEPPHAAREP